MFVEEMEMKQFFRSFKYWSSTVSAMAMIVSLAYVIYSTNKNMLLVSQTIEQSNEQLLIQKKSIPAQFEMTYRNVNTFHEQAFITNTGKTLLRTVAAEYKYYFIDLDDAVLTEVSLQNKLKNDPQLFEKFKESGLIVKPKDFTGLLGTSRKFFLRELEPRKESLLEVSSSSIQNAMKISKILKSRVFTRWKIKYNEELSNKEVIVKIFIWLNEQDSNNPLLDNYGLRKDLKDVVGGKFVTKLIEQYEDTSKEVIFNYL